MKKVFHASVIKYDVYRYDMIKGSALLVEMFLCMLCDQVKHVEIR